VWALVIQQVAASVVNVLTLWWASDWRPRWRWSRSHANDLFRFSAYVVGSSMLDFLNRRTDDFLIGYYRGATLLGVYALAYRVLLVMIQLLASTVTVAFSAFSRLQADRDRLRNAFYRATRLSAFVAFPVCVGLVLVARDLVIIVFGSKWEASVPVLRVLAWVGLLHSLNYYFTTVYLAVGRPDLRLKLLAIHTVASVTAFAVAVRWGIVAVALAYVIRGYLLVPMDLFALKRLIGLHITRYMSLLVRPALASTVMAGAVIVTRLFMDSAPTLVRLGASVTVGAVVYALASFVISPDLLKEARGALRRGARPA
jgi:PST family polysaccharide transporter